MVDQSNTGEAYSFSNTGEAYSFFYCNASKSEILEEFPRARRLALTPENLELILIEGINPDIFEDEKLKRIAYENLKMGRNYTMVAVLPGAPNEKAYTELGDIYNCLYASPIGDKFYKNGDWFPAEIVY
ncbi:MAG: hypothetical protein Q7S27_00180 [Nanoarchaeota archaeon]|nr:hypothetical protein [Nanoarchaeota archaeon]